MSDLELEEPLLAECSEVDPLPEHDVAAGMAVGGESEQGISGVRRGVLVGIADAGRVPLVVYAGQQTSAAVAARSTVDLHAAHVGREVVLMFEDGDPGCPIILGCLIPQLAATDQHVAGGQIELDADGERLIVTARDQLVLRCGKASITITKAGKILLDGTYISSRSSGVNRLKGGSVQIN
jgi:hypothetical protein